MRGPKAEDSTAIAVAVQHETSASLDAALREQRLTLVAPSFPQQQPLQSFAETVRQHRTLTNYLQHVVTCGSGKPFGEQGFDLGEALLYLAHDGVSHGLGDLFDAGRVQQELFALANDLGRRLTVQHQLAHQSLFHIVELPLTEKMEIARTVAEVLHGRLRISPVDGANIAQILLERQASPAGLSTVCAACLQIIRRGGIELPLYPAAARERSCLAWCEDFSREGGKPLFWLELDEPGGRLVESLAHFRDAIGWNLDVIRHGFLALPLRALVSGELNRTVDALLTRAAGKDRWPEQALVDREQAALYAKLAVDLWTGGRQFRNLARCEGEPMGRVAPLTMAIRYDGSRENRRLLAETYLELAVEAGEQARQTYLRQAVQNLSTALKLPPEEADGSFLSATGDFNLKSMRSTALQKLFWMTGNRGYLDLDEGRRSELP